MGIPVLQVLAIEQLRAGEHAQSWSLPPDFRDDCQLCPHSYDGQFHLWTTSALMRLQRYGGAPASAVHPQEHVGIPRYECTSSRQPQGESNPPWRIESPLSWPIEDGAKQFFGMGRQDSNLGSVLQRHASCRWTTPQGSSGELLESLAFAERLEM